MITFYLPRGYYRSHALAYPLGHKWECRAGRSSVQYRNARALQTEFPRWSLGTMKQLVYAQVQHDSPAEIIAEIEQLDAERAKALAVLKGLLA